MARPPGQVRDAILAFMGDRPRGATVKEVVAGVQEQLGDLSESSVRSYLAMNEGRVFTRIGHGRYKLRNP